MAYSAANAYLDAFASRQRWKSKTRWLSINWDGWGDEQEQEAATEQESRRRAGGEQEELAIRGREGVEAMKRIMTRGGRGSQVVVSTGKLEDRIEKWVKMRREREQAGAAGGRGEARRGHERPEMGVEYVGARDEVERKVVEIWEELLGIEGIGVMDNFFVLGGDSLVVVRLISRLRVTFQMEFPVEGFFDAPTVAELAEIIKTKSHAVNEDYEKLAKMLDVLEQLSEDEVKALMAQEQGLA
jgi:acyl carrier protein